MSAHRITEGAERREGATMRSLRSLGFADRTPEYASTKLGYDMGGWELSAQEMVNLSMVPIVSVTGLLHTQRIIADIEIQMLQTFDQPEKAAAFLVFSLDRHRNDLTVLPQWWSLGEENLHLHPVVQERERHEEHMRAWRARPHCRMEVDHARLFRRQLRDALKNLAGGKTALLSFDGQVLRVSLAGKDIAVLASGEAWPHCVSWPVSNETKLPGRFKEGSVTLGFFENKLDLANYRYSGASAS